MLNIYTKNNGKYHIEYANLKNHEINKAVETLLDHGTVPSSIVICSQFDLIKRKLEILTE